MRIVQRDETNLRLRLVVNKNGGVVGLTATVRLRDIDVVDSYLDFSDGVWKTGGWTTLNAPLTDLNGATTPAPGSYEVLADISGLPGTSTNLVAEFEFTGTEDGVCIEGFLVVTEIEDLPTAAAIADAVLTEVVNDHVATTGSLAEAIGIVRGFRVAYVLDGGSGITNVVLDSQGLMTAGRVRVFSTPALATAATLGAVDGADGELANINLVATAAVAGQLENMTMID